MASERDDRERLTQELLERAAKGDRDAISELYRLYRADMIGSVRKGQGSSLRGLMESVDLVQSLWTDVLEELDGFEYRGPGSFPAWLRACLANKIREKQRFHLAARRDARQTTPLPEEEILGGTSAAGIRGRDRTPSLDVRQAEELECFLRVLDEFPEVHRTVLVLRLRDELPYAEIAKRIGRSVEATKRLGSRAQRKLVEALAREGFSPEDLE